MEFFVDLDGSPQRDLALETDLLDCSSAGAVSLFLYSWASPVVVLGYGQKDRDVDLEWCRKERVPVYRRLTGGTGVVHRADLAVSLFLPSEHSWADRINNLYQVFLAALAPALETAGGHGQHKENPQQGQRNRSPICFEDQLSDTLVANGRKVVGCAQARRAKAVLIHAAVSLNLAADVYAGAFAVTEDRIKRGLGDAIPGARADVVAPFVGRALAEALRMNLKPNPLPEPSRDSLERYGSSHWAPLYWGRE